MFALAVLKYNSCDRFLSKSSRASDCFELYDISEFEAGLATQLHLCKGQEALRRLPRLELSYKAPEMEVAYSKFMPEATETTPIRSCSRPLQLQRDLE